jgi:hypothetical protein
MIRFLAGYAADESRRAQLGIGFATVLPQLTPATELGAARGRRIRPAAGN